jgi:hypothetical protein
MYSSMSCLTDASPTIDRGIALHKVFISPLNILDYIHVQNHKLNCEAANETCSFYCLVVIAILIFFR